MNVIWKYDIPALDEFALSLPKEAEVIHVNSINDKPYMWIIHDPTNDDYEQRIFYVRGTGHNIKDEDIIYLGTFIILKGFCRPYIRKSKMKRYMIYIEADIPILDEDLKDDDYDGINPDILESHPDVAMELAAVNAVQRIVGHTGIQVIEAYCSGVDAR